MESKEVSLIMSYVGVWGWQIISLLFLVGTFILFALPKSNMTIIFGVAFFLVFGGTQFICTKRRRELQDENES